MTNDTNQSEIPLKCYENGKHSIFSINEAYKKFWQCNYGWICLLDWYRFYIEGYSGQNNVYKIVGKKAMKFGFLGHTRKEPLTIDDAEVLLNDGYELEVNTFVSWSCKFNKLFKEPYATKELPKLLRPFYYLEVPNGIGDITRPAYKMHPERTSFVIIGVDPASPYSNADIDWTIFQTPPDQTETSILSLSSFCQQKEHKK
ncbi:MAG TPA: hypothetical protein ENH85_10400 [Candidatus Scalindua sp.]|nr:hypothetical protein [Candidatus Scalindua sp.]